MTNAFKPVLALCLAVLPMAAFAQQSEFNYVGLHGGVVGGPLLDNAYGIFNEVPEFYEEVDTNPISYGIEGFRMTKPDEDGMAFGFMLSGGTFTFDVDASTSYHPSWSTDYRYWGAGLLVGNIFEGSGGRKSTAFLGLEYLGLTLDTDNISSSFIGGGSSISATTGALSVPFGFYSTLGETGLSAGLGGRYFVGDPDGFYEVFASIGYSF
ncbi:MAG: hypothetical protein KC587_18715 [Nitrospira sp.]|nr:hypothetical protein [Nitrospira sp.]MCB1664858.1 hypothetical protein [Pseudomonadales bacterium]